MSETQTGARKAPRRWKEKQVEIKVIFDRKKVATKMHATRPRKGTVSVEVYYDGKRALFSTGVKVYADQFRGGRVYNHGQQGHLNTQIKSVVDKISNYVDSLANTGEKFNLVEFRDYMERTNGQDGGQSASFLDYMAEAIERRDIRESTKSGHRSVLKALRRWGVIKNFSDLTLKNIKAWHELAIKTAKVGNFASNREYGLKVYVRLAYNEGFIDNNPYSKLSSSKYVPANSHRYITEEELTALREAKLDNYLEERARDIFLFQVNTGMAYVDAMKFDISKAKQVKGKYCYEAKRQKTGETFYIPLTNEALDIIQRHGGRVPRQDLSAYDINLKRIAKLSGIKDPISSHWARHTFAMICLNKGMPIEILAAILGHSQISTTQIYAKIQKSSIDREFWKIMDKM